MGWHGSSMTAGSALGAPVAGFAIDLGGWQAGFLSVCVVGFAIAVVGALAMLHRQSRGRVTMRSPGPRADTASVGRAVPTRADDGTGAERVRPEAASDAIGS